MSHDEVTPAETPESLRLSMPEIEIPPGATDRDLVKILTDAIFKVSANLEHLKAEASSRLAHENVNAFAIRTQGARFEQAMDAITGRRWGRITRIRTAKLRLVLKTAVVMLAFATISGWVAATLLTVLRFRP